MLPGGVDSPVRAFNAAAASRCSWHGQRAASFDEDGHS